MNLLQMSIYYFGGDGSYPLFQSSGVLDELEVHGNACSAHGDFQ